MELTPSSPPNDKREALKWHNRRAIVVAAATLARERGVDGFSVNDLAAEAGVSRRTIFNHFSGVQDAVQGSFLDAISGLYGEFHDLIGEQRFPDLPSALSRFAEAAGELDVIGTVCQAIYPFLPNSLTGIGPDWAAGKEGCDPRQTATADLESLALRATNSVTREIVGLLHQRVDHADPFETHLLGEYLIATMTVCADQWFAATCGELTEDNRALWHTLLERAMSALRRGFTT